MHIFIRQSKDMAGLRHSAWLLLLRC